jgi:hypothetical protein
MLKQMVKKIGYGGIAYHVMLFAALVALIALASYYTLGVMEEKRLSNVAASITVNYVEGYERGNEETFVSQSKSDFWQVEEGTLRIRQDRLIISIPLDKIEYFIILLQQPEQ